MSNNDPLANVLSHIQNYEQTGKKQIITKQYSKLITRVLDIMNQQGYIGGYEVINDSKGNMIKINLIGAINKCNVIKPRFQINKDEFEKYEKRYLPSKDFGIIIISTNQGLMTHKEAKEKRLGGTLISYCY